MTTPTEIRLATDEDLPWCVHLHKQFAYALGFIPKTGMANAIAAGHVTLATEETEPAGYLLSRRLHGEPHIHSIVQAAVAMDAQRRHHGLAALVELEARAGTDLLQCWCAEDLESNAFWCAAGFLAAGIRNPENVRSRKLILWRKPLTPLGAVRLGERPKRAGPHAARPKNLIILTADQRAKIQTEPPAEAIRILQQLGREHPATNVTIDVAELLRVYRLAQADPELRHVAKEIEEAITNHKAPRPVPAETPDLEPEKNQPTRNVPADPRTPDIAQPEPPPAPTAPPTRQPPSAGSVVHTPAPGTRTKTPLAMRALAATQFRPRE
jgi:hypothetical protein